MDSPKLTLRVIAAGLPLLLIALIFGAIGYALADPETTPIPPLEQPAAAPSAATGEIAAIEGGRLTIVTEDGRSLTYTLPGDVVVEVLRPISLADVRLGDWLNGGAIPHPQTVLALLNLVLLPDPVTP